MDVNFDKKTDRKGSEALSARKKEQHDKKEMIANHQGCMK